MNPQRKGQWIVNYIRKELHKKYEKKEIDENAGIHFSLWNMTNRKFDKIMREYES